MKQISPARKAAYYIGLGLGGLGVLLFISTFFSFASDFGRPRPFYDFERSARNEVTRAVVGMVCIVGGAVVASVGAKGVAGSGLKLDPKQAREDLEPWAQMAGGIVSDALEEVEPLQRQSADPVVKVRCPNCRTLNDDDARYCKSCGGSL